jgi:hypothetical protein
MRNLLTSTWLWVALSIAALAAHVWYAMKTGDPVIVQRGGTLVIVFGIVVAGRAVWRGSLSEFVARQLTQDPSTFAIPDEYSRQIREANERALPEVERDVRAERVVGVLMVMFGTFVTGYGDIPLTLLLKHH